MKKTNELDVLAIDPGVKASAWALFEGGRLISRGKLATADLRQPPVIPYLHPLMSVLIECPQVYTHGPQAAPGDLIDLAMIVGRLTQTFISMGHSVVGVVLPRDWKGQVPKATHHARMTEALTDSEVSLLSRVDHNVRDAVCLGLWFLGRFKTPSHTSKISWKE